MKNEDVLTVFGNSTEQLLRFSAGLADVCGSTDKSKLAYKLTYDTDLRRCSKPSSWRGEYIRCLFKHGILDGLWREVEIGVNAFNVVAADNADLGLFHGFSQAKPLENVVLCIFAHPKKT